MGVRISDLTQLWTDGLVPYEIDNGDFPAASANRQTILDAIDIINKATNATFTPRDGEADYVKFVAAAGSCSTVTGMLPGENTIGCDLSVFSSGNLVHEMCHELGLHHEQVREDRDSFVTINWDKIEAGGCRNFKRKVTPQPANYTDCVDTYDPATQTLLTTDVGSYDYGSIMHYGNTFFLDPGETGETITTINPAGSVIGQRTAMSPGDISTLNEVYNTDAIYVRDNLTDDGEEPLVGGGLSLSPDIIHLTTEPVDAQAELSSAAAMASANLSEDVEFGQTNYVYVRLQKNGTLTDSADVDLYYTPASTLPSPDSWTQIGATISEPNIAPGDIRIVGPFLFNNVPAEGHYCFVAVVNSRKNPAPNLDDINTFSDFTDMVRNKSNMAWKNFDVVNIEAGGDMDMDFHVKSMKFESNDNILEFDLSPLPNSVTSEIRIIKRLTESAQLDKLEVSNESKLYHYLKTQGGNKIHKIKNMNLKSREDTIVRLKLSVPANAAHGVYDINVRQLKGNTEFGRITRRINIGKFPYIGNKNSNELHRANCPWVEKMSGHNKVAFTKIEIGLNRGYDGCHTCLLEHDHG